MKKKHIEDAGKLFNISYSETLKKFPMLPQKYEKLDSVVGNISWIEENHYGVVAIENNEIIGYLTGIIIPEFKCSNTGVYCPEWGHSAKEDNREAIYSEMYKVISKLWYKDKCVSHGITFLADQKDSIEIWNWNGFAPFVTDGVCELNLLSIDKNPLVKITRANVEDVMSLVPIQKEHDEYMTNPPTYLNHSKSNEFNRLCEDINEKGRIVWSIKYEGKTVGIMNTKIDSDDACTIVQDVGTVSILTTHILDEYKGLGIGKEVVNHVIQWAIDNNYERCSVDFESANYEARRFWSKHFSLVCHSLIRYVDDRLYKL